VKVGVVASSGNVEQILEAGALAEETGWDGFFTWDGISVGAMDTFDPWVILGALATRTTRITLGAMIFALPRRKPWEVARQSITVDHLSGGRLVLPVGLGAVDDAAFSRVSSGVTDARTRAELLDETLAILELAWSGKQFSFEGKHYQLTDFVFQPRPVQSPRIPVWVVAAFPSNPSMGRAARWDAVLPHNRARPFDPVTPDDVREVREWVDGHRPPEAEGPFEIVIEGVLPAGAEGKDRLAALEEAGATWWIESHWTGPVATPRGLRKLLAKGPPRPS
jgi:alkanesulfonate monooxygenase SsuD/methylene tetrahydromethanopterin reductase-like flavin-dependent oxidoreductase (luciferase family)